MVYDELLDGTLWWIGFVVAVAAALVAVVVSEVRDGLETARI